MRKPRLALGVGVPLIFAGFLTLSLSKTHTLGKLTSWHEPYVAVQGSNPRQLPAELSAPFAYSKGSLTNPRIRELERDDGYVASEVSLAGAATVLGRGGEITLEYFMPLSAGRAAVVVMLPIMKSSLAIERFFARYYARRGIAAVILTDVHSPAATEDIRRLDSGLRETVIQARQAIDWIETRAELDRTRIGVLGLSMGGIRASLLAAVDTRVRGAALALVGSDLPHIVAHSNESVFVRLRAHQLQAFQRTPDALELELRSLLHSDPGRYAAYIDAERTLLVLALYNSTVSYAKGAQLRSLIGNPETITIPTGHYSSVVYSMYIRSATFEFLRAKLQ